MIDLASLRTEARRLEALWRDAISARFPGCNCYHWSRALAAEHGENVRRNDDTRHDAALATDRDIARAYDEYLAALHAFYRARDGEHGLLGKYPPVTYVDIGR